MALRPRARIDSAYGCLKSMVTAGGVGAAPAYIALVPGRADRTGHVGDDATAPAGGSGRSGTDCFNMRRFAASALIGIGSAATMSHVIGMFSKGRP